MSLDPDALYTAIQESPLLNLDMVVSLLESRLIEKALVMSGGNLAKAAKALRVQRTTLIMKMKRLHITRASAHGITHPAGNA